MAIAASSSAFASGGNAIAAQSARAGIESILRSTENSVTGIRLRHKKKLLQLYTQRNFAPLWSVNGQYTDTCRAMVRKLDDSQQLGLHPSRYYTKILGSWLRLQESQNTRNLDVVLTDVLFEYFDNLANGQTGKRPGDSDSWFARQDVTNTDDVAFNFFQSSASLNDAASQIQPVSQHYNSLLQSLKEQQTLLASGGYTKINKGPTLKPGMQDSRVIQLRQRLKQSGDYTVSLDPGSNQFDNWVVDSLKTFQTRHGLKADGLLGKKTLEELNTPIEKRIQQIEINLDRWRWLPKDLGQNYIIVNTAGFEMEVVQNGYKTLDMNVVVGKPEHKTPIFSKNMQYLSFNPLWHVPKSITRKNLLPRELANPGYLKKRKFVAVSLADNKTRQLDSFSRHELEPSTFIPQYRLMQLPGSDNALGRVKFMLPNQYAIYLHDTIAKNLFQRTTRAYSHGCIRVEDPVKLAKALLINEGHSEYDVEERFNTDRTTSARLHNPLPVHMTYQTAWVDKYNRLNFRNDIYGHDSHAIRNYQRQRPSLAEKEQELLVQQEGLVITEFF